MDLGQEAFVCRLCLLRHTDLNSIYQLICSSLSIITYWIRTHTKLVHFLFRLCLFAFPICSKLFMWSNKTSFLTKVLLQMSQGNLFPVWHCSMCFSLFPFCEKRLPHLGQGILICVSLCWSNSLLLENLFLHVGHLTNCLLWVSLWFSKARRLGNDLVHISQGNIL